MSTSLISTNLIAHGLVGLPFKLYERSSSSEPLLFPSAAACFSLAVDVTPISAIGTYTPLVLTSIADENNTEDLRHNGNGEFEFLGDDPKTFYGIARLVGVKDTAGASDWLLTMGVDTGSGLAPIDLNRDGKVRVDETRELGNWCSYTVTLNKNDKVRPMISSVGVVSDWDSFNLDHSLQELFA